MNLYVWEGDGVLQDYTCGMIIAIANNLEEAYAVIERDDGVATYQHEGKERTFNFPRNPSGVFDLATLKPVAFTCWGGG